MAGPLIIVVFVTRHFIIIIIIWLNFNLLKTAKLVKAWATRLPNVRV